MGARTFNHIGRNLVDAALGTGNGGCFGVSTDGAAQSVVHRVGKVARLAAGGAVELGVDGLGGRSAAVGSGREDGRSELDVGSLNFIDFFS